MVKSNMDVSTLRPDSHCVQWWAMVLVSTKLLN